MVAGCSRIDVESPLEAELKAIHFGLKVVADWRLNIAVVFTDCIEAKKVLELSTNDNTWRTNSIITDLKRTYNLNNMNVEVIPRE